MSDSAELLRALSACQQLARDLEDRERRDSQLRQLADEESARADAATERAAALERLFGFASGNRRRIETARSFGFRTITLLDVAGVRPIISVTSEESFAAAAIAILDAWEPDWRERT